MIAILADPRLDVDIDAPHALGVLEMSLGNGQTAHPALVPP